MSYRTVALLDVSRADVQRDISDRDYLHKTLMSVYPDNLGGHPRQAINLLFSLEDNTGELVFQADLPPCLDKLSYRKPGYLLSSSTSPTSKVGLNFETNDTVSFELSFAAQETSTALSKRVDIIEPEAIQTKVSQLLARTGLVVNRISLQEFLPVRSARRRIKYNNAVITGQGLVTDAISLKQAVHRGVGSGRVWGSGVLLINRV